MRQLPVLLSLIATMAVAGCTQTGQIIADPGLPTTGAATGDGAFDVATLELHALEDELFSLINEERERAGAGRLTRDPRVDGAARTESARMATEGFLSEEDPEGRFAGERLLERGIFHFGATELVYSLEPGAATDVAQETVAAWLARPVDRARLLDYGAGTEIAGVGISCITGTPASCTVAADLASTFMRVNRTMRKGVAYPFSAYPGDGTSQKEVVMRMDVTATQGVDVLVLEEGELQKFLKNGLYQFVFKEKDTTALETTLSFQPGDVIVIDASKADIWHGPRDINLSLGLTIL